MRHAAASGFMLRDVVNDILIPRYYDPRIENDLKELEIGFSLHTIGDLVQAGMLLQDQGKYIPKIHYGSGPFPYIRTSDLANWELRASPKHGMSRAVYDDYADVLDVRPLDIFFVHEGTYLIGTVAAVTPFDGPILYQHHLARFRVLPNAPFGTFFFLASLASPLVQRQIRARQFSADIIDSVVSRMAECVVPVPRLTTRIAQIEKSVGESVLRRVGYREKLSHLSRSLDAWFASAQKGTLAAVLNWQPKENQGGQRPFLGERTRFTAFKHATGRVVNDILVPKYYDPHLGQLEARYTRRCRVVSIGELVESGVLELDTGDEIGRLNYGSGPIPFVRTSDIGSYELKHDAKQGVAQDVYDTWRENQDVRGERHSPRARRNLPRRFIDASARSGFADPVLRGNYQVKN